MNLLDNAPRLTLPTRNGPVPRPGHAPQQVDALSQSRLRYRVPAPSGTWSTSKIFTHVPTETRKKPVPAGFIIHHSLASPVEYLRRVAAVGVSEGNHHQDREIRFVGAQEWVRAFSASILDIHAHKETRDTPTGLARRSIRLLERRGLTTLKSSTHYAWVELSSLIRPPWMTSASPCRGESRHFTTKPALLIAGQDMPRARDLYNERRS